MMRLLNILSTLLCCCVASAQSLYVSSLTGSSELPVNEVTCILQDHEGYMWFGTSDGLCRYDGYNIKVIKNDFNNPGPMKNNHIFTIEEDAHGNIWYSTMLGVYMYNRKTAKCHLIDIDDLPQRGFSFIVCTKDNNIWIGGTSKLYHFNPEGQLKEKIPLKSDVSTFYEDSRGNFFMGVYTDGLYCKPAESKKFKLIKKGLIPTCMTENLYGEGYLVCSDGIAKLIYHPETDSEANMMKLPTPKTDNGNDVPFFTHIVQDDYQHNFWLLSYYRGIMRLNREGTQIQVPENVRNNSGEMMTTLFKDHHNRIWMSGFNSGCKVICWNRKDVKHVDLNDFQSESNLIPTISNIVKDKGGYFWFYQERKGLYVFDEHSHKFGFYNDNIPLKDKQLYQIKYITEANQDNAVWVAYYGNRILKLHREGIKMIVDEDIDLWNYSHDSGEIECLRQDDNNVLWIGTQNGLFKHVQESDEVVKIPNSNFHILKINISDKGDIWLAMDGDGLAVVGDDGHIQRFQSKYSINAVTSDKDGIIWCTTNDGRCVRFNPLTDHWQDYSAICGLDGKVINDILSDSNGRIWMTLNQQLREINPNDSTQHVISTSDGNVNMQRFLPLSLFYDKQNEQLFFGGIPGILCADLKNWGKLGGKSNTNVLITDIRSSNMSIWNDMKRHKESFELYPNDRNVVVYFSDLNIINSASTRYAYRLLGNIDEWVELEPGKNQAVFNNLNKGHYILQVRSINQNGQWNELATELKIYRVPAWYESGVAYLLYGLLTLMLLTYFFLLYKRHEKVRNDKKIAEQMVQTKLGYFTNISHELLTPLAVISSINDNIEPVDEETANKKELIKSNLSRLKYLLQQILDFRKTETGNMKLYVELSNLSKLVEQRSKESFIPLAQTKDIKIIIVKPVEDIIGFFDTDKIEKVLFNLVSNAIKYSNNNKKVIIRLETDETDGKDGKEASISVEDEGIGIDNKDLNKIFNSFYTSSGMNPAESNGIGLSLTKNLVELHHGTIKVSSQKGKGSIFRINFPINREAYSNLEIKDRKQEEQIGVLRKEISRMHLDRQPATGKSLLIVEDNLDMLSALDELLAKQYYTYTATNGKDALSKMTEHPEIEFVVSDISMPDMDGIQLCKHIKENINSSHIIVVMLTAMVSSEMQIDSYNAGADAWLAKPFESKVLLALLANLWNQKIERQKAFRGNPSGLKASGLETNQMDRQLIDKAISIVQNNIDNYQFDVDMFASEMAMSRSTLTRKLKAVTGDTPLEFIKSIKMKHAYQLLQSHTMSVIEVVEAIGYNDRNNFTNSFKDMFGISPGKV